MIKNVAKWRSECHNETRNGGSAAKLRGSMLYYRRFFQKPGNHSFFLFGPRGTGKSTLMKYLYGEKAIWIDLLRQDVLRAYLGHPERLYEIINASKDCTVVVIDEIQKAPGLLSVVHSLIEEKRGIQFALTGSSSRKLKRTGADLLAGRALRCVLHPFMAVEMNHHFSLETALKEGMLPLLTKAENPERVLDAYVNLYLSEEIQTEGLVRHLDGFVRFLEVISFSHGSILNVSNVARECAVKRKTVESYVEILNDLLLSFHLPVFTKRAQREMSAHSKFYLFDVGIFRALRPRGPLDRTEEIEGAALEGLVAQHLLAWCDYSSGKYELSFWRTRSGVEVDFIIYGEHGFWAIEVKNGSAVYPQDTKSLEAFIKDYPAAKGILLYRGQERFLRNNILCLPCNEFLIGLTPNKDLI